MVRILIVGGGRVGAPLAAWLANKDEVETVSVMDTNEDILEHFRNADFPWEEPALNGAISSTRKLFAVSDMPDNPEVFDMAFICVGSPVNNGVPEVGHIMQIGKKLIGTQVILRSTVPPGTSDDLARLTGQPVIHAPERLLLGYGMKELGELPQIVGCTQSENLFPKFMTTLGFLEDAFPSIIMGTAVEAELAKICNNTVRYIEFAVGTELSQLMTFTGADPHTVRQMMTQGYGRGRLAFPSFVGSYCLDKDWQMLAHRGLHSQFAAAAFDYNQNLFKNILGENIHKYDKIGILGLTYKPGLDDTRNSLTWKLLEWLKEQGKHGTLIHDPLVNLTTEQELKYGACSVSSSKHVLEDCELLFVMTAHDEYRDVIPHADTVIIDPAAIIQKREVDKNGWDFIRGEQ
tara:strand:- start:7782 stop:8993 length:1212 start_codon:yes stop_codon:yes gene_type:complete